MTKKLPPATDADEAYFEAANNLLDRLKAITFSKIVDDAVVTTTLTDDDLRARFEDKILADIAKCSEVECETACYDTAHDIIVELIGNDYPERMNAEAETRGSITPISDLRDWVICTWYENFGRK